MQVPKPFTAEHLDLAKVSRNMTDNKETKAERLEENEITVVVGVEGLSGETPEAMVMQVGGLFCTEEDINQFHEKSDAQCPTFGNCSVCFASGQVGEKCCHGGNHGGVRV